MTRALVHPPATRPAILSFGLRCASLAAAIAAGLAAGVLIAAAAAVTFFGFEILGVSSGSMAPGIRPGDLVVVRPVPPAEVEPGDVILYDTVPGVPPTLHRVIGVNEVELTIAGADQSHSPVVSRTFVTRGDANPAPDASPVEDRQVRGVLLFTVPRAGHLLSAGDMPWSVPLAVAAAWLTWEAARRLRHR